MTSDYASLEDFKAHWPDLDPDAEVEAAQKLHEASVEIRALYPDLDARLESGALDPDAPRLVACRMVKRAMSSPVEAEAGVTQVAYTTGPFTGSRSFSNPDQAVYLSAADKRLLGTSRDTRRAFTVFPSGGHCG